MITENINHWEDPLPKLVSLYFDNALNERELKLLQTRLKSDQEARIFFAHFSALQTQLEWVYTDETDHQEMTYIPESVQKNKRDFSNVIYISTCACLVLCALLFIHMTTPVAHVFPVMDSLWAKGPVTQKEALLSGAKRHLLKGEVRVKFTSGSIINVKAPALIRISAKNAVFLDKGKLIADIPRSGHGFEVETHAGRIVDLGTAFSVNVNAEQNTKINVFRGKVKVAGNSNSLPAREIQANEAVRIDPHTKRIVFEHYSSSDFIPLISRDYPVLNCSESIIFQEKIPNAIANGSFHVIERDNHIFLFPERQNVNLNSDLNVSISQPGKYWSHEQIEHKTDIIPRGTQVDCYRLYYDPANDKEDLIPVEGEIEFKQSVLGLITTRSLLLRSDFLFNPLFIENPQRTINHQETEIRLVDNGKTQDFISLSPDRKTLSFKLFTGTSNVDELRVLVSTH